MRWMSEPNLCSMTDCAPWADSSPRKTTWALDMAQNIQIAKEYREHIRSQWRDRLVYWRMRAMSRALYGNWLAVMLDGAD